MFTRLLVGLDGSEPSRVALAQAIELGKRFRSRLLLAHVSRPSEATREEGPGRDTGAFTLSILDDAAARAAEAGLQGEMVQRRGGVVEQLVSLAHETDAVFVGRAGLHAKDPLGPETRALIQRCPVPVFVAATAVAQFDRCAVAYDGGPTSQRALAFAARLVGVRGGRLEVITAGNDETKAEETLARAGAALSESPLRFGTHFAPGAIGPAVDQVIRALDCDALFTGAHRVEGRAEMPSHTEELLSATDIAVVVQP
ncbi:MAG: universal stress protein [Gemmatimonadales bacterium]